MRIRPFFTQILGRHFLPKLCGEVHPETAPLQALCCALCSTEQRTFRGAEKGSKCPEKGRKRGGQQRGQKGNWTQTFFFSNLEAQNPTQNGPGILGPATAQNLVVKFDGEICGGVLVENASDDFPSKRSSKIFFQTSPEVCHQFRRKLRQLHSGNRWCLEIPKNTAFMRTFRKVRANFCLLPCDVSLEPGRNC